MTFGAVVPHLARNGFASRSLWTGASIVFFGPENTSWVSTIHGGPKISWHPSLSDLCANDWFILPYFWTNNKDDRLPFDEKDSILEKLREDFKYYNQHYYNNDNTKKYSNNVALDNLSQKYADIMMTLDLSGEFNVPWRLPQRKKR